MLRKEVQDVNVITEEPVCIMYVDDIYVDGAQ